jgi:anti-anti-sigma factor
LHRRIGLNIGAAAEGRPWQREFAGTARRRKKQERGPKVQWLLDSSENLGDAISIDQVIRQARQPGPAFRVRVTHAPEWDRLTLEGELDIASAPTLRAALGDLYPRRARLIVVDLRSLSFIDLTGMRVLLTAHQRAPRNGSRLAIIRGPRAVHRLFELVGADEVFDVVEDPAWTRPAHLLPAGKAALM